MLDIKFLQQHTDEAAKALATRGVDIGVIHTVLALDEKRRSLIAKTDEIKKEKNKFSKKIGNLKPAEKKQRLQHMERLTATEHKIDAELKAIDQQIKEKLLQLPNIPDSRTPSGNDESENREIKAVGDKPAFDYEPRDYMQLASRHDMIDTERAAKVSGSRFGYLKNDGALLWNALVQYTLHILIKKEFTPFYSPALIKEQIMYATGYNTYTEGQDAYYLAQDKLFLVGTGEHALLPYHRDEILDQNKLPLRYTTYSACFRREAGSYGKDTKGILRVHQFDKQELLAITMPDQSQAMFDELLGIQEQIISSLELPYRLLAVCTGDLPRPSSRVIDLECWLPSENKYRETHSVSNCTDYQARRNAIRVKTNANKKINPHVLNATAITPRVLIALIENYQQADGSINIPRPLQQYMFGKTKIST